MPNVVIVEVIAAFLCSALAACVAAWSFQIAKLAASLPHDQHKESKYHDYGSSNTIYFGGYAMFAISTILLLICFKNGLDFLYLLRDPGSCGGSFLRSQRDRIKNDFTEKFRRHGFLIKTKDGEILYWRLLIEKHFRRESSFELFFAMSFFSSWQIHWNFLLTLNGSDQYDMPPVPL